MTGLADKDLQAKISRRLRYYQDLGIQLFYKDRVAPAEALRAEAAPPAPVVAPTALKKAQPSWMGKAAAAKAAAAAPVREPLPVTPALTLFEAASRIENDTLERIRGDIGDCQRCRLCERRNTIVFGDGHARAELMFIGEGPGHDEDVQGLPFVGRAGKLLTQMIEAMGLARKDVYIANVVKCRPPENRTPEKDEVATCSAFLFRQIDVIRPKVIVCLGGVAAQALLNTNRSVSHFRGEWLEFRGSRLLATYHPAYLLRNLADKAKSWADLCLARDVFERSAR